MIRFLTSLLLFCACLLPYYVNATPLTTVEKLQSTLLNSAANPNFTARYQALLPVVRETHNFNVIARLVTGRHWRKMDKQQRAEFVAVFTELSVVTYADRFKNLSASTFSPLELVDQPRNAKKVISTLSLGADANIDQLGGQSELTFEYILQTVKGADVTDNDWRIINLVVDGISDLAIKRSNYVNTLNEQGFNALLTQLNENISEVRNRHE